MCLYLLTGCRQGGCKIKFNIGLSLSLIICCLQKYTFIKAVEKCGVFTGYEILDELIMKKCLTNPSLQGYKKNKWGSIENGVFMMVLKVL